ncbi:MAG: hypothetical protein Q9182_004035 [Xanthomendoza sp. 2 TL-2023]
MSSDESLAHQPFHGRIRPTPSQLQTNDMSNRNQRFSWQNTPLEAQQPMFHQFSSPTNSTIDESPISPRNGYQAFPIVSQPQEGSLLPAAKPSVVRTGSPYDLGGPLGTHPAYFAPLAEETERRQPVPPKPAFPQSNGTNGMDPEKVREPIGLSQPAAKPDDYPHDPKGGTNVVKADTDESVLVYNPDSLAGPNATLENHRPGQVAHPNAAVEPEWKHGMSSDSRYQIKIWIKIANPNGVLGNRQRVTKGDPGRWTTGQNNAVLPHHRSAQSICPSSAATPPRLTERSLNDQRDSSSMLRDLGIVVLGHVDLALVERVRTQSESPSTTQSRYQRQTERNGTGTAMRFSSISRL